jgi:FkbM family methyltransferase
MLELTLIAVVALVCVSVASAYIGLRAGIRVRQNLECCHMPTRRNVILSFKEALGFRRRYYGEHLQDKWVTETVFPGVHDGYFVDVGSGDGIRKSNTKLLEEKGWRGICIDPFPTNMQTRRCQVFNEVVSSERGRTVQFHLAGGQGGIAETLGRYRNTAAKEKIVEMTTVTLDDILVRAGAPPYIHFMSLDVEGAELEALRGLSLDRYSIGALVVEHNYELSKQTEIRKLLSKYGYIRTHSWREDDFYVRQSGR